MAPTAWTHPQNVQDLINSDRPWFPRQMVRISGRGAPNSMQISLGLFTQDQQSWVSVAGPDGFLNWSKGDQMLN